MRAERDGHLPKVFLSAGFSMIELLIVIVIIGIIAAIAIPGLLALVERARQNQSMEDLSTLAMYIGAYHLQTKHYPVCDDITVLNQVLSDFHENKMVMTKDGWGNFFLYNCQDGLVYSVTSMGADGRGTHGDDGGFFFLDFNKEITIVNGAYAQKPE
jgi:type II secretion system protein G